MVLKHGWLTHGREVARPQPKGEWARTTLENRLSDCFRRAPEAVEVPRPRETLDLGGVRLCGDGAGVDEVAKPAESLVGPRVRGDEEGVPYGIGREHAVRRRARKARLLRSAQPPRAGEVQVSPTCPGG